LTSALDAGGERASSTHWIGGWVRFGVGVDIVGKRYYILVGFPWISFQKRERGLNQSR
jgi:hypothetical protein